MADEQESSKLVPPYISWQTFDAFVAQMKSTVVPTRIDPSVLKHMSGTVQSQLLSGLKFLRLIETDNTTSPALRELVAVYETPKWKEHLGRLLKETYAPLLGPALDITTTTSSQLKERFRDAGVGGETIDKCVRFLLMGFKAANVQYSPLLHLRQRAPRQTVTGKRPRLGGLPVTEQPPVNTIDRDVPPDGTFKIPLDILRINATIYLPEGISEARWEQISGYVKTVISLRTKADNEDVSK
jgi:hypothetical protein